MNDLPTFRLEVAEGPTPTPEAVTIPGQTIYLSLNGRLRTYRDRVNVAAIQMPDITVEVKP